jgi:hypothetical protein
MKNPLRRKRSFFDRVPSPSRNKSVLTRARKRMNGRRNSNPPAWVGVAAGAGAAALGLAAVSVKSVRAPIAKAGKFMVKRSAKKAVDKPQGAIKDTASAAS